MFRPMTTQSTGRYISLSELSLVSRNRLLWEQHVAWTRMTFISLIFKLPDVSFVVTRLLRNATDMGNAIRPCYGDQIANQYAQLIREHLFIEADLVKALLSGNPQQVSDEQRKWHNNADQITVFWSNINPFIDREAFRRMFYEHLRLTTIEATTMITKDFKADVAIFDQIEAEALEMADAISIAMVKQFPQMFK